MPQSEKEATIQKGCCDPTLEILGTLRTRKVCHVVFLKHPPAGECAENPPVHDAEATHFQSSARVSQCQPKNLECHMGHHCVVTERTGCQPPNLCPSSPRKLCSLVSPSQYPCKGPRSTKTPRAGRKLRRGITILSTSENLWAQVTPQYPGLVAK